MEEIIMLLQKLSKRSTGGYTTFGSVWKKGEVREAAFTLTNEAGDKIPVQTQVKAWWPDRSIKWASHTADSVKMGGSVMLLPVPTENEGTLWITEAVEGYQVDTGVISLKIPAGNTLPSHSLAKDVFFNGILLAQSIYPVFSLERRYEKEGVRVRGAEQTEYRGTILSVTLEEAGPLQAVFCFRGNHLCGEKADMPFVIRMYVWSGSREIRFVHTFLYDGEENRDYLKGMGIRFDMSFTGKTYDRHIQFATDGAAFHEAALMLASSYPRLSPDILRNQLAGEKCNYDGDSDVEEAVGALPIWDRYSICQDSAYHYEIKKQTKEECCRLSCRHGYRAPGAMAVSGAEGGVLLGIKDFWQKYPSGLEVRGLGKENGDSTIWFYSPETEAYDFRHYATESYPRTCYEGFDEVGASAYGIGVTSEATASFFTELPSDDEVLAFSGRMQKPAVYAGTPEYYHEKRAFGYWSLPKSDTGMERWLEEQMDQAFTFYRDEIEARNWYGLFDYGDVMHTYDAVRHCWKYDVGGFAWQNTELVPTYWLWLYFLRTGREDVYTMAEAMSRHCSEVDVYHFGQYKGLGSRHNVRHWGCSCKEPRVAMAGHHRFLYYLTGDHRLEDVFEDVKDADYSMVNLSHSNDVLPDGRQRTGVRSGPDWSSFVSNWMTEYERTLDEAYRKKIETGTRDIAATPYGFASGPDYYYDVENAHLIYKGEVEKTPNQHLQICMGGPQIWLEAADMLEDDTLKKMLADLGAFYYLSREEKIARTGGRIADRPFSWPMFAVGIAAYSAMRNHDKELGAQVWRILLENLDGKGGGTEFRSETYAAGGMRIDGEAKELKEIPWISTNCTSQWCINAIWALEFIREYMPELQI